MNPGANNRDPGEGTSGRVPVTIFLVVSLTVVLVQGLAWLLIIKFIDTWEHRSSFGEMFGSINTLFSGLAFAGVIYAILLQRRELELQRHELEMTRTELARSAQAQEKSEEALSHQAEALRLTARINLLNLIPALNCDIYLNNGVLSLAIINGGNTTAYDVSVVTVGVYSPTDILPGPNTGTLASVAGSHNEQAYSGKANSLSVHDILKYPLFPQKRRVVTPLAMIGFPSKVYLFLQFRDMQGNNYHQIYLFASTDPDLERSRYYLTHIEPQTPKTSDRIDDISNLGMAWDEDTLTDIQRQLVEYWRTSRQAEQIASMFQQALARGQWDDI